MAQRRILGLLRSMALLLGRRSQTEEEWAGPADTGDLSRYLRERAESFTVEVKAIVQHGHTMSDSVPFPNQDCSRLQPIPERLDQQVAANPARSIGSEQITPRLVQLFRAEGAQIFDFRREALDV